MLKKGFARMALLDCLKERVASHGNASTSDPTATARSASHPLTSARPPSPLATGGLEDTAELWRVLEEEHGIDDVLNKRIEKAAVRASAAAFERMVAPGTTLGMECGNQYTGRSGHLQIRLSCKMKILDTCCLGQLVFFSE